MPKQLVIDSFIGRWGYSKQLVRAWLNDQLPHGEKGKVIMSSLGGDLDHATAMYDMFAERKNDLTASLSGFNASAATFVVLPLKTSMSSTGFYLIHKALSWVDEWGMMNEDDIDSVIEKLTKEKEENKRITLMLAKHYLKRASQKGKTLNDVLELMKKDTWISATEAHSEWGFVDEVFQPGEGDVSNAASLLAPENFQYFNAIGLPEIKRNLITKINIPMNKEVVMPHINGILNVPHLVVADEGSFLSEDSLLLVESELDTRQNAIAQRDQQITERDTTIANQAQQISALQTELQTAQSNNTNAEELSTLQNQVQTLTQERDLAKENLQTIKTKLASMPAAQAILFQGSKETQGQSNGVDWDEMAKLPHNQQLDSNS